MKRTWLWSSTVQGGGKRRGFVANFVPARQQVLPATGSDWLRVVYLHRLRGGVGAVARCASSLVNSFAAAPPHLGPVHFTK